MRERLDCRREAPQPWGLLGVCLVGDERDSSEAFEGK